MLARWLPTLAIAVVIGTGAWLATAWFWYFANPQSPPAATSPSGTKMDIRGSAESLVAARVFGAEKQMMASAQVSSLNIKLKGVFAGDPARPAFAIVNTGSRDEFALAGKDLMPGVRLEAVHSTHILVNRNGVAERVNLEERSPASLGGARPSPALMAPRPSAPAPLPGMPGRMMPGGQPLSLSSESLQNFGRIGAKGGAVSVEAAPPGSTLGSLGLQPGDVIRSINGQSVTSEADLARIYQDSAHADSIQAEVVRGGRSFPIQVPLKR